VAVLQGFSDLLSYPLPMDLFQNMVAFLLKVVIQREIGDVFHNQMQLRILLNHLKKFYYIGVAQFRQDINLPLYILLLHWIL